MTLIALTIALKARAEDLKIPNGEWPSIFRVQRWVQIAQPCCFLLLAAFGIAAAIVAERSGSSLVIVLLAVAPSLSMPVIAIIGAAILRRSFVAMSEDQFAVSRGRAPKAYALADVVEVLVYERTSCVTMRDGTRVRLPDFFEGRSKVLVLLGAIAEWNRMKRER